LSADEVVEEKAEDVQPDANTVAEKDAVFVLPAIAAEDEKDEGEDDIETLRAVYLHCL